LTKSLFSKEANLTRIGLVLSLFFPNRNASVILILVDNYDILFLSETWLHDSNLIDIDGFVKISCVNRSVNIGKRNEGGLAVFCRHFLNDGITVEKDDTYVLYNEKNDVHCFSLPEFVDPL
jgi:hypothetical protein